MSKDEHGIDIERDTDLEPTDDGAGEEAEETRQEAAREPRGEQTERDIEQRSEIREREVEKTDNPDAHRDEEPFNS